RLARGGDGGRERLDALLALGERADRALELRLDLGKLRAELRAALAIALLLLREPHLLDLRVVLRLLASSHLLAGGGELVGARRRGGLALLEPGTGGLDVAREVLAARLELLDLRLAQQHAFVAAFVRGVEADGMARELMPFAVDEHGARRQRLARRLVGRALARVDAVQPVGERARKPFPERMHLGRERREALDAQPGLGGACPEDARLRGRMVLEHR